MFKDVKSCSVRPSPKFCFCYLFMIDSFLLLDTFEIADLDRIFFVYQEKSCLVDFAGKE